MCDFLECNDSMSSQVPRQIYNNHFKLPGIKVDSHFLKVKVWVFANNLSKGQMMTLKVTCECHLLSKINLSLVSLTHVEWVLNGKWARAKTYCHF